MKKERNTYQKNLIKNTVLNMCDHPSADHVYDRVKKDCPNISRATVYRVLNDLADKGELRRVKVIDGPDRYDRTLCRHYHIKCVKCGKVDDSSFRYVDDMVDIAEKSSEYKITGHEILFEGICPECVRSNK